MIIDSHAHLDMPQFDADRADVIGRAGDNGLDLIITVGTGNPSESSVERTLDLVEKYPLLSAAIGVHPHDARLADDAYWEKMESWAFNPKVVIWGEIGLDYYYDLSPRQTQREVFRRQLQMARRLRFPVSIHCRDAWDEMIVILREEWHGEAPGGILHSFSGSPAQALEGLALGFLLSFSGMITFKNAEMIRETAKMAPLDKILVETDAPYLAPVPHRGRRNEPMFVRDVASSLAQLKGIEFYELARRTSDNLKRLIGKNTSSIK
jgi:TatD DNase family protein